MTCVIDANGNIKVTPGIHDHASDVAGGQDLRQIQELNFDDATVLGIVGGTVTRTQVYHIIAAEAGVADDLDQIDGGLEGDELVIQADAGDTITVRHNAGGAGDNIWLAGGADISLDNADHLRLIFNGTWWCDQSGGAGGAACSTWDEVYDCGGAGAGRTATADAGAFQINGAGGLSSQGNIVLDDGAGDSPDLQLIGGSNDDTVRIFLDDDAVAGRSDLVLRLAGNTSFAHLNIEDSAGNVLAHFTGDGDFSVDAPGASGDLTVIDGLSTLVRDGAEPAVYAGVSTASTSSVKEALRISHAPSAGSAGDGMGVRLAMELVDDAAGTELAAYMDGVWTDASNGSEEVHVPIGVMSGGAAAAEVGRFVGYGLNLKSSIWRIGEEVLDLDFTGTDFDTKAECNAVGLRFSDTATPFPTTLVYVVSGTWGHVVGKGWLAAPAVDEQGPAILIPICRPGNWELEVVLDYDPVNVGDAMIFHTGYIANSNHVGAYGRWRDGNAAANEIIASLHTNDGDDTYTSQWGGDPLAGTGDRTTSFRCVNGCVGVWDPDDGDWNYYTGRQNVGHAYTAAWALLQFYKYAEITFARTYLKSLKLIYLL